MPTLLSAVEAAFAERRQRAHVPVEGGNELESADRRRIQLAEPLKTLGDHDVTVKLHRDVSARLRVKIVPAE